MRYIVRVPPLHCYLIIITYNDLKVFIGTYLEAILDISSLVLILSLQNCGTCDFRYMKWSDLVHRKPVWMLNPN